MPNDMTQPLQALRHANVIRHERMLIRHELAGLSTTESRLRAALLIEDPPWWLRTARISRILEWTWQGGPRLIRDCRRETHVNPDMALLDATPDDLHLVAEWLRRTVTT